MLTSLLSRFSAFFSDSEADSLPDIQSDGKIKFYSSNKRIFNAFFAAITVGTFVAMLAIILYYVFAFAAALLSKKDIYINARGAYGRI